VLNETDICKLLPRWRKASCLKQDALAQLLGVTQTVISNWETGKDIPTKQISLRLLDAMSASSKDRFALDRVAMASSRTVRASFDLDGVRLVMISQGLIAAWPTFSSRLNARLADHLVDEASQFLHDDSFVKSVKRGEVAMVSAVSDQHVSLDIDVRFRHRWTAVFRSYGTRSMIKMNYDKCDPDVEKGIENVLYFDDIAER
jgi:transcriptional regulator with XRE-family HTH domain